MNARQKAKKMKKTIEELERENSSLRTKLFLVAFERYNKPEVQLYRAKHLVTGRELEMLIGLYGNPEIEIRRKLSEEIRKSIEDKLVIKQQFFDGDLPSPTTTKIYETNVWIGFER